MRYCLFLNTNFKLQLPVMIQKKHLLLSVSILFTMTLFAQDPWNITAGKIDPANYYGITVANGMIGVVSSDRKSVV